MPMRCQQCKDAPCLAICPKGAIYRDPELGSVRINHDQCIGGRVFKCDLCHGDPQCVLFCDMKAVDYVDVTKLQGCKMRESAENYSELMRRHGGK